ncbi:MAG: response regulator transcription factor [Paludibacter sp.]|nr:response regulator transcription factor [Paludibacter sp.]
MEQTTINKPTLIIVDDHKIFLQGLDAIINNEGIATVIGQATNGLDFIKLLKNQKPDLVLMDIEMPLMNGMEATRKALEMVPDIKIIALTMYEDEDYYYKMIDLGVKGFILKSTGIHELKKAIHDVMLGESFFSNELLRKIIRNLSRKNSEKTLDQVVLTKREIEVLKQIFLGLTTQEIADKLNISPKTVKSHRSNLLEKTTCKNAPSLILYALKNKILDM